MKNLTLFCRHLKIRTTGIAALSLVIWLLIGNTSIAQQLRDISLPPEATDFCYPNSKLNLLHFREHNQLNAATFFADQKEVIGLEADDEMRLMRTKSGQGDITHYRFNQYYKGVPLEFISYSLHEKNGILADGLGKIVRGMNLNVQPTISEEMAIQAALKVVPATVYSWEDEKRESRWKEKKHDPQATHYPHPELVIAKIDPNEDPVPENFKLMYRVSVSAVQPRVSMTVYMDALTGEVIRKRSNEITCSPGSVNTTWNGTHTIYTVDAGSTFESIDDCIYSVIYSYNNNGDLYTDSDNNWANGSNEKQMAINSLWAVREATNYFAEVHDLIGFDGEGDFVEIFNNMTFDTDCSGCNSSWDSDNDNMNIGFGNTHSSILDDYNTIDICGHELTHGVIEESTAIDYDGMSGAINESFADIFGNMVENWVENPSSSDKSWWGVAEDRSGPDIDGDGFRNMANPKEDLDPATFHGQYWEFNTDNNDKYVHTNSGVGNYAFYLMSEGGTGTNDNGLIYDVTGMGHLTARFIAFEAMTFYADSDPNYEDIRDAYLLAAQMLYGNCSQEHIITGKAWEAVGVGNFDSDYGKAICGTMGDFLPEDVGAIYEVRNAAYDFFNGAWAPEPCSVTIEDNFPVSVHASGVIRLQPGFEAKSGSTFSAFLNSCDITYLKIDAPSSDPDVITPVAEMKAASSLMIYPNPASKETTVAFNVNGENAISISIIDINNRVVLQPVMNEKRTAGMNQVNIDVSALPTGVYQVVLLDDNSTSMNKLVVVRQ